MSAALRELTSPSPLAGDDVLRNPGLLKLDLMMRGLRVPAGAARRLEAEGLRFGVTGHALFGSAGDLDLVLPGGTWASVPVAPAVAAGSPYVLDVLDDGYALRHVDAPHSAPVRVQVRRRSHFYEHRTADGLPYGRFGTVHGPYMALSPTNRCSFLGTPSACHFCGVGQAAGTHRPVPVDDLVEAVRIARDEHPLDIVYLSVGHLGTSDGGVRFVEPYVAALKKHFDVLVALDALPPEGDGWIDRTYGIGVDAVSYNLELWDPRTFARICPGPAEAVGRQRFLDALQYATTVFPSGAVTCHLIVGAEPLETTRAGVDALTAMGVLPVLPIHRPFKGHALRDAPERLSLDALAELYAHLWREVRRHKLNPHLVRDIAIVSTPLDGRFFADEALWTRMRHRVMGTRLGRKTSTALSDLRRALRVREIRPDAADGPAPAPQPATDSALTVGPPGELQRPA